VFVLVLALPPPPPPRLVSVGCWTVAVATQSDTQAANANQNQMALRLASPCHPLTGMWNAEMHMHLLLLDVESSTSGTAVLRAPQSPMAAPPSSLANLARGLRPGRTLIHPQNPGSGARCLQELPPARFPLPTPTPPASGSWFLTWFLTALALL
jgi:hypothetical protein